MAGAPFVFAVSIFPYDGTIMLLFMVFYSNHKYVTAALARHKGINGEMQSEGNRR
ncbi:hypothetical protein DSOL_2817 [Desulfosporosinus metallidurans]|uniref:Uncharacterized protein n=1 Tax=Desulfosporosinus metallidurans TaxID=1888891 RepID=A0A1Q8QV50_9FIRM|nr:hypothetical protein DSOL_2817 [Desulfosporosinus metallidurans]